MSGLRPIGSEKLEGLDKIKRIMEIARYNEHRPSRLNENESTEYKISLSDGNQYEIVKEKLGYIIKKSINESVSDYIEPMKNRKYYSSYSQALKKLNLMAKEFNVLHENSKGTSLFSEQKKKFKLKLPKSTGSSSTNEPTSTDTPVVSPEPETPTPATVPPMGGSDVPPMGGSDTPPMGGSDVPPMGGSDTPPMGDSDTPPMDDTKTSDASDTYDDMGSSVSSDGYDDDMGSKKDGKVSMKLIQKLIGKSAQKIRSYLSKDDMDSNDTKYIINSILSALDLSSLDDDDIEEIISRLEGTEEDEDEMDLDGEEDIDFGDEDENETNPIEPSGEVAETYDSYVEAFNDYMGGSYSNKLVGELGEDDGDDDDSYPKHGSRQKIRRYPHERYESMYESVINKVINKHIDENEIKISNSKSITKTKEKIVNLSESIRQERAALKFLEKNPNSFLVGSTSKGNLLFKTGLKENKITPEGKVL